MPGTSTVVQGKIEQHGWMKDEADAANKSFSGLYGHWGGDWVDEDSLAKSEDKISLARLDAEKAWIILGKNMGVPTQVFSLGGIYGPGRSALDTIIKQKQQELSGSQKARRLNYYTSRIHVVDICQAILASIEQPSAGKVYNVVDDDPAPRAEVFSYALSLLETKWPGNKWEAVESGTSTSDIFGEKKLLSFKKSETGRGEFC
ncbi:uncharacterized protein LOC131876715 [Cryptomeria japonica]|uniref:uncharacterized protein LOC131876715 n=1 Tax=Cryptomeria japonica TaxID=3369 RepID=UPI0027DA519E|nr:uncharacterized protein LOC131876715 [Cryptomeria japonica]